MPAETAYNELRGFTRQTALLEAIESLLSWDERCLMPASGGDYRAEQMALLAGIIHDHKTDPRVGAWLAEIEASSLAAERHSDIGATVGELRRQYDKLVKLPKRLVEELTRTAVLGQQVWQQARRDNDYAAFAPLLKKTVELKRAQIAALGYAELPYDALLDYFEPRERTTNVAAVLAALKDDLVPLVAEIRASPRRPDLTLLKRVYPVDAQAAFGRMTAAAIGFDFNRGRLDVTVHPFCSGMGPNDCRITTRYDERFFNAGLFSILHEAGHGIYDQGLPAEEYGLPLGSAVSMGIHESQSRMWENLVGRSRAFWQYFYGQAQQAFPQALGGVALDDFYFAVNDVRPSLIRVEADECTYNLHILVRFELEQALVTGDLTVDELPGAWNERYRDYLGIVAETDRDGVLQDIHWSAGLFGYFPTYALGNLYAAQFFAQAETDLGELAPQFAGGQFAPLRRWLSEKIHKAGQRYSAAELVERVTGQPLSHRPLLTHLRQKFGPLYGLES